MITNPTAVTALLASAALLAGAIAFIRLGPHETDETATLTRRNIGTIIFVR